MLLSFVWKTKTPVIHGLDSFIVSPWQSHSCFSSATLLLCRRWSIQSTNIPKSRWDWHIEAVDMVIFVLFFLSPPLNRQNRNFVSNGGQLKSGCRVALQPCLSRGFVASVNGRTLHSWSGTRFPIDQPVILNAWRSVIYHPGSPTWNMLSIVGSLLCTCQILLFFFFSPCSLAAVCLLMPSL